jgi:hypothetical protein
MDAKLMENRRNVRIDRAGAKRKGAGDLTAGLAQGDHPGDLGLARGERFPRRVIHRGSKLVAYR